jgi:Flp pilus assembly protein TadD
MFAAHRDAGRLDRALALMTDIVNERPDDPDVRVLLGSTLMQVSRVEEGIEVLRQAAQLGDRRPTDRDAHWAAYHFFRGDMDQALRHYRASLRLSPTDTQRLRQLGSALLEAARRARGDQRVALLRECLQVREREAEVAPGSRDAQRLLAEALENLARMLGPGPESAELERRRAQLVPR